MLFPSDDSGYLMYGGSWCPFCKKAKLFFEEKGINFGYVKVEYENRNKIKVELEDYLKEHKTFPMIFYNKTLIGGYTDLIEFFEKQKTLVGSVKEELLEPTNELLELVELFSDELGENYNIKNYEVLNFKTQLVNGTIFYCKLKSEDKFYNLKVYQSFDKNYQNLMDCKEIDEEDEVKYF